MDWKTYATDLLRVYAPDLDRPRGGTRSSTRSSGAWPGPTTPTASSPHCCGRRCAQRWADGFGTTYTAVHRPGSGSVDYLWPSGDGDVVRRTFLAVRGSVRVRLDPVAQVEAVAM